MRNLGVLSTNCRKAVPNLRIIFVALLKNKRNAFGVGKATKTDVSHYPIDDYIEAERVRPNGSFSCALSGANLVSFF